LTINGTNHRNAHHHSYGYYGNGKHWQRKKYTRLVGWDLTALSTQFRLYHVFKVDYIVNIKIKSD